jgi:hypothetical protein
MSRSFVDGKGGDMLWFMVLQMVSTLVSTGGMDEEKWRTDPGVWKVDLFWEVGPMQGAAGSDDFYALDSVYDEQPG